MSEPLFDPTLKKKKKKKQVAFSEDPLGADADPTTPAQDIPEEPVQTLHEQMKMNGVGKEDDVPLKKEPVVVEEKKEEEDDFLTSLGELKKKKKKKDIPMDLEAEMLSSAPPGVPMTMDTVPEPAEDGDADFDLSDLKKKKKKSKKVTMDLEAFEKDLDTSQVQDSEPIADVEEDAEELGDNPFAAPEGGAVGRRGPTIEEGNEPWAGSDRDYKYPELLSRFFTMLHAANPALASNMGKRYTIAPPQILREGNKKSIFANIPDICKRMHRQPEHVIAFMLAEMGTTGSVDGSGRLVIKGRFLQKQIENVLRRYIVEYVTCKTCKSPDTILTKENRIYFLACESCGSRRSVSAIKSGFQAQVGKRSKNKVG